MSAFAEHRVNNVAAIKLTQRKQIERSHEQARQRCDRHRMQKNMARTGRAEM